MVDRIGLGWRAPLAAGILSHLDEIDVLEVIAEQVIHGSVNRTRALTTLARDKPLYLHGTTLGLASASPLDDRRLDRMARLVEAIHPEGWSEHLAFVRAGDIEIGHLAGPPRNEATLEATIENIEHAAHVVGRTPFVENVASLLDPPGSTLDEPTWLRRVGQGSGAKLVLDLHNLYANAKNAEGDAHALLAQIDPAHVGLIHLAGGRLIPAPDRRPRILDDHLHPIPGEVFELLEAFAERSRAPLTVIVERDGNYPPIAELLEELRRARTAVARGRAKRGDLQGARW